VRGISLHATGRGGRGACRGRPPVHRAFAPVHGVRPHPCPERDLPMADRADPVGLPDLQSVVPVLRGLAALWQSRAGVVDSGELAVPDRDDGPARIRRPLHGHVRDHGARGRTPLALEQDHRGSHCRRHDRGGAAHGRTHLDRPGTRRVGDGLRDGGGDRTRDHPRTARDRRTAQCGARGGCGTRTHRPRPPRHPGPLAHHDHGLRAAREPADRCRSRGRACPGRGDRTHRPAVPVRCPGDGVGDAAGPRRRGDRLGP
jgi:hypothetical protein